MKYPLAFALVQALFPSVFAQGNGYPPAEGWIPLYAGGRLDDWTGDPAVWSTADSAIVGGPAKTATTFLWYHPREFSDFHLEVEVRLVPNTANAGIQYRSAVRDADAWVMRGYQADVGEGLWGSLYDEHARNEFLAEASAECAEAVLPEDWNLYRIEAEGNTLRHFLNGIPCLEFEDTEADARHTSGLVGVQVHSPGDFEVRYRNIRVLPLDGTVNAILPADSRRVARSREPAGFAGTGGLRGSWIGPPFRGPPGWTGPHDALGRLKPDLVGVLFIWGAKTASPRPISPWD